MKRNSKFVALLVTLVLVCSGTLTLTSARDDLSTSKSAGSKLIAPATNSAPVVHQGDRDKRQEIAQVLKRHDALVLEPQRVLEQVRQTGRLSIPTADGTFDLSLAPHDMKAANYRAEVSLGGGKVRPIDPGPVLTYKGTVAGMADAQARFTIDGDIVEGLIITPSDLYFVEPAARYSGLASSRDYIVYKTSDLIRTSFGDCGTLADKVGSEVSRVESHVSKTQGPIVEELFTPSRIVELATEADFDYYIALGANAVTANNQIISIMNSVEGIYNAQFGLQFTITFQNVWATAGDPYTTTDPSMALDQFADHWEANRGGVARDLAHMWTGKDLDDTTIGIAFRVPWMTCPRGDGGYGLSQRLPGNPSPDKFLLAAHEIGHNFGAEHSTGQSGCANSIMETTLGSGTLQTFCTYSVNQITARANSTIACLSQTTTPGCTYSISPSSQSVGVSGGSGSTNVTTAGTNCAWGASSSVGWVTVNSGSSGVNNGTVSFGATANSGFARSAIIAIADKSFTVNQAGASSCPVAPISYGQTLSRSLSPSDCVSPQPDRIGSRADQYSFSGAAGDQIRVGMTATGTPLVDTFLYLIGPSGAVLDFNDDINYPSNTNSGIPVSGFVTLPTSGTYVIEATSFDVDEVGAYTLTLTSNAPPPTPTPTPGVVQFSASIASATETLNATTKIDLTINRTVNTSIAASVNYASADGSASERSDYLAVVGTVRFAPGETSKTFPVFIVDDSFGESAESFTVALSNPVGCSLAFPATVTVTINSDEAVDGSNPVRDVSFNSDFFVREHYVDFFNREADAGGLAFWKAEIDNCTDQACREIKRINVSAAFFLSGEFQQTGYLVYKTNQAAFATGETLQLRAFLADTQEIGRGIVFGAPGFEALLEANKQAFFLDFVQRPAFLAPSAYPTTLTAAQFVDKLNGNTFDPLNPGAGGALTPSERDALVAQLSDPASPTLRAQVVRAVSENGLFTQRQFNKAFVLMQYFGYMRRNPNAAPEPGLNFDGYNFWLGKLNQFGGNFVNAEMVKAFITSGEYIQRFGP